MQVSQVDDVKVSQVDDVKVSQVDEKLGKKIVGELAGVALDAVDVLFDLHALHTSMQEYRASFASSGGMQGLHAASIHLRMARSRLSTEYVQLKDAIATSTNNALWDQEISLAVREEPAFKQSKPLEVVRTAKTARAQQLLQQQAADATPDNGAVAENGVGGFGDCCGGPGGKEGPDDALWERIQRTPGLQEDRPRSHFSAMCMAPGENSCQSGCGVDEHNHLIFCAKGQICRRETVHHTTVTDPKTFQRHTIFQVNKCYDVTECPLRETVLATHLKVRSKVWDDPACTAGCHMATPCGGESGVPCCVRKQNVDTTQCPSRATVLVTREEKRWPLWDDPHCTTGCTLHDCGVEVPCCVKVHPYNADRQVSVRLGGASARPI